MTAVLGSTGAHDQWFRTATSPPSFVMGFAEVAADEEPTSPLFELPEPRDKPTGAGLKVRLLASSSPVTSTLPLKGYSHFVEVISYGVTSVDHVSAPHRRTPTRKMVTDMKWDEPLHVARATADDGVRAEPARAQSGGFWRAFNETLRDLFLPMPPRRRDVTTPFDDRLTAALDRLDSAASRTEDRPQPQR